MLNIGMHIQPPLIILEIPFLFIAFPLHMFNLV